MVLEERMAGRADCWLERIAKQEEREYIGKRIK